MSAVSEAIAAALPPFSPAGEGRLRRFFLPDGSALTPKEGWTTIGFLLAMDLVVILTVEQTQWIKPTPRLWAIALLSFIVCLGAVKLRGPLPVRIAAHALALGSGALIALLETAGPLSGGPAEKLAEVVSRGAAWASAVTGSGISNDRLPFIFILAASTWLIVYLSILFAFVLRWSWAAVIPPAIGLMTHQTYLPPKAYAIPLFFFLLFAILFMGQTHLARTRPGAPRTRSKGGRLTALLSLVTLTAVVLGLSWSVPVRDVTWQPLRDSYLATRGPYASVETNMERMFAGVPAKKSGSLHSFGNAMPLRGSTGAGDTPVFTAITDYPAYWRGQTYDFYQGQGWLLRQDYRQTQPSAKSPIAKRATTTYKKQALIAQQVTLQQDSDVLFTGGHAAELSADSTVDFSTPRAYQISLVAPPEPGSLPPDLYNLAQRASTSRITARQVRTLLPSGTEVVAESAEVVTVKRTAPAIADVLSIRGARRLKPGTTYDALSLASIAGADDLRGDVATYPKWVQDAYLQLPPTLPPRVRELAVQLTKGYANPYEKAEAIQAYLRALPETKGGEPLPLNVDAVDYFLFTQKSGYGDYFASAMTVLLRAADIPARLTAGFSSGEFDPEATMFTVRQNDAHTWPEVYFPTYGWIAFEPLPSMAPITRGTLQLIGGEPEEEFSSGEYPPEEDELMEEEEEFTDVLAPDERSFLERLISSAVRTAAVLLGALAGLAVLLVVAAAVLWQINFIGLPYGAGMYARMALLGGLAWRGPGTTETPKEYALALGGALALRPGYPDAIAAGFIKTRYAGKDVSNDERIGIERAWRAIRKPLLRRIADRVNVFNVLKRDG